MKELKSSCLGEQIARDLPLHRLSKSLKRLKSYRSTVACWQQPILAITSCVLHVGHFLCTFAGICISNVSICVYIYICVCFYIYKSTTTWTEIYGYGSIPINTIFSGMNIHLPAILMFTRGTRFLTHCHIIIELHVLYRDAAKASHQDGGDSSSICCTCAGTGGGVASDFWYIYTTIHDTTVKYPLSYIIYYYIYILLSIYIYICLYVCLFVLNLLILCGNIYNVHCFVLLSQR